MLRKRRTYHCAPDRGALAAQIAQHGYLVRGHKLVDAKEESEDPLGLHKGGE